MTAVRILTRAGVLHAKRWPRATAEGRFRCSFGLAPGAYRVHARTTWGSTIDAELEVPAGSPKLLRPFVLR